MGNEPLDSGRQPNPREQNQSSHENDHTTKLSLAILVLVGAVAALLIQHHSGLQQRGQIRMLLQQINDLTDANGSLSNRLARLAETRTSNLPERQPIAAASPAGGAPGPFLVTNLYGLMTNNNAKLTVSQLDHYLENHRS